MKDLPSLKELGSFPAFRMTISWRGNRCLDERPAGFGNSTGRLSKVGGNFKGQVRWVALHALNKVNEMFGDGQAQRKAPGKIEQRGEGLKGGGMKGGVTARGAAATPDMFNAGWRSRRPAPR